MKKNLILGMALLLLAGFALAELPVGEKAPLITLSDKLGGRIDGTPWSSSELTGKVWVVFYADPDESDLNDHAADALKAEKFPDEQYGSVAVVNMAATWKPNRIIEMILKKKQESFPSTIYVKDYKKTLVEKWNLADDSNDVVAFDKEGVVIFSRDGKLSDADLTQLIKVIRENL